MRGTKYDTKIKTAEGTYVYLDNLSCENTGKKLREVVNEAYKKDYKFGKQMVWDLNSRPKNVNKFLRGIITIKLAKPLAD